LIELLHRADPGRTAVVGDDSEATYGSLLAAARAVAAGLQARRIERFGVVEADAARVIALLAGASLVGAEAALYAPTDTAEAHGQTAARFDHDVVVSDTDVVGTATLSYDALISGADGSSVEGAPPPVRPALILTTGTTGVPRGVRHDWNRLLRSVSRVQPAPEQRWLLAYGLHQFAGFQIVLHVLAAGATLVAPSIRRPKEGLAAMRRHGVEYASATPTYWRFVLAELRSDGGAVPALRQITLGGEAVPGPLLEQLRSTFPQARISQVYAASEFGSTGSVRDRRAGLPIEVLQRGDDADIAMKVVDGELWVRSRVGMLGYYGEDPVDADAWRPTGDVVEIVGDRIEFRGRVSEIINVGGVKVHPLPIEERVAAVDGVAMARVYGRANPLTGSIVAIDVVLADGADEDAVRDAIRAVCADLPAPSRPRSIKFVDTVAMTGSKIVRRES
jgi:acyl-CoA synthetase (AMP-forming)/AMP-acid ligase II